MGYLGNEPTSNFASVTKDLFSGDGSTTAFTLSKASTTNGVAVFVENVRQEPTIAYAVSGTTLTFTAAPVSSSGNNIYVLHHNAVASTANHPAAQDLTAVKGTFTGTVTAGSTLDMNGTELILDADADTSITADTDDQIDFKIGGSDQHKFGSEVVFNEQGADINFRIEGDGNANLVKVDAGNDRVGFGTDPTSFVHMADASGFLTIERYLAGDAAGPGITFLKTRASAAATYTAVADNDVLGAIYFQGADGTDGANGAYIRAQVNGTPGNNDMPTELQFATSADSSHIPENRFTISAAGLPALYLSSSDNNYVVNANAQGSAGSTGLHNLYFKADSAVFTGYHYYAKKDENENFEMGDVVVLENGKATKCTKAKATNVVGIISGHPMGTGRWLSNNKDVFATEETAVEVASVGDSQDWNRIVTHYLTGFKVCNENGSISSGDLLCSASKTGYLMKQDGTTITTETVGKSMDDVTFDSDGTATGIYGFLYCG